MLGTPDADPRKRDIMCQNPALTGLKRHEKTIVSMLFSAFGAYMGDAEFQHPDRIWRPNGQFCGRKCGLGRKAFVVALSRSFGAEDGRPERAATKCPKPNGKRSAALGITVAPASRALKGQKHFVGVVLR